MYFLFQWVFEFALPQITQPSDQWTITGPKSRISWHVDASLPPNPESLKFYFPHYVWKRVVTFLSQSNAEWVCLIHLHNACLQTCKQGSFVSVWSGEGLDRRHRGIMKVLPWPSSCWKSHVLRSPSRGREIRGQVRPQEDLIAFVKGRGMALAWCPFQPAMKPPWAWVALGLRLVDKVAQASQESGSAVSNTEK